MTTASEASMAPARRVAPPLWWLMFLLALGIAGYGLSFTIRGIDAFPQPLLTSFNARPLAVWLHVIFGSVALVTGALNFRHGLRRRRPAVHRAIGTCYVLASIISAGAGGWLACFAYGGLSNRLGFGGLALATLGSTLMAYREARARRFPTHRAWMIRSYALILAAVTLRIQLPILAISLRGFDPAYAIIAWSCWLPNLAAAEFIVRTTTRRTVTETPPGSQP